MFELIFKTDIEDNVLNVCSSTSYTLNDIAILVCSRAKENLGIEPDIIFEGMVNIDSEKSLNISNARLMKYFRSHQSLQDEIDMLLNNCKKWFS